ncbi:hypothetical protein JTE90_022751 [Oedothorax gibbosus]|uniref:Reverse transcriptase RNase H-like domain-containing protein n=1 Tax=Oedothorax gibbosus TaxID=931172 RepID=A0AAV6US80_9ARAC|nr:hypothetical protein JTE90_022751 [Oedothorax gibbosus]
METASKDTAELQRKSTGTSGVNKLYIQKSTAKGNSKKEANSGNALPLRESDSTSTKLRVVVATHASPYGISAVISHTLADGSKRPIAFASRTLSDTETRYSQIDKEALAIVWGIKRFPPIRVRKTVFVSHRS